jgi:hypothetical protein
MAEEVEGSVAVAAISAGVAAVISAVAAISAGVVVVISAAAISLGLAGVVLVAIALQNTEEGASNTEIISGTKIISGMIAISFLEVPFCMIIRTTGGMIIRTTGITRTHTTDIRTTDIMGTTAFAVNGRLFQVMSPRGRKGEGSSQEHGLGESGSELKGLRRASGKPNS